MSLTERREAVDRFIPLLVDFLARLNLANASFDWWAFSIAGKNPLSAPFPGRAFELWLAREENRAPSDDASPASLKRTFSAWLPLGPAVGLARALWRRRRSRRFCADPRPGPRYAAIYSNIRPDSFDAEGNYRDIFFGSLLPEMRRRGLTPLVFGEIAGGAETLARCAAHSAFPIVALEHFADGPRLWAAFRRAFARRLGGYPLVGPRDLDGLDLGDLLREELAQNLRETRYFNDLLYHAGASGLFQAVPIEVFYLPYENMARDRMLLTAASEARPPVRAVGYQHTGITPQHLNFRLGAAELPVLPLPRTIVTMSEATRDLLAEWGFPAEKLAAGCALRQAASAEQRAPRPAAKPPRLVILLATSLLEARTVLDALEAAFKDRPDSPEILVRAHPSMPRVAELVKARRLEPPFRDGTGEPLGEAWAWADAVVYASSTLGIEAIHRGIPAIFFDIGGVFSVDPGVRNDALKWTAGDPADLRRAVSEIAALAPEKLKDARRRARAFTERYLTPASPRTLEAFFP